MLISWFKNAMALSYGFTSVKFVAERSFFELKRVSHGLISLHNDD